MNGRVWIGEIELGYWHILFPDTGVLAQKGSIADVVGHGK
jgi:hypothetical protein